LPTRARRMHLIRISFGLEHIDDLAADFAESIERAS
jgi:cystathionine beta-lyase/cystathionine gamma-synthase